MCGINLIVDKKDRYGPAPVRSMLRRTKHRGPDHQDTFSASMSGMRLHMAVNRLKISDLSDFSNQPFCPDNQSRVLAYNGALYNRAALKNDLLAKGYHFQSNSDTELLYYHLSQYGIRGTANLNGMYAFAFYDPAEGSILFGRDVYGIKPLYYYENDELLIVSSEIKGILASGLVEKKLNARQIDHYLATKYAEAPETFYHNIYELPPGNTALWNPKSGFIQQAPNRKTGAATDQTITSENVVDLVHAALQDALMNMLDAEVPLGLMLSGGVDSTLLLALASRNGFTMPTFTVSGAKSTYATRDGTFAERAARQYGSVHTAIDIQDLTADMLENHISTLDQPVGDSSTLMTALLCGKASSSVKVLLSGAGADELFAGYNRHRAFQIYLRHRSTLTSLRPVFPLIKTLVPAGKPHPLRKKARLLHKFLDSIHEHPSTTFAQMSSLYSARQVYPKNVAGVKATEQDREKWLFEALQRDRHGYLIYDVLALTDTMSMLHGVEVRLPYLDQVVSGIAESLPANLLLKKGRKWILTEMLVALGGKQYTSRAKEGFGLPIGLWTRNQKHDYLWEPLKDKDSVLHRYVDQNITQQMVGLHAESRADYSQEIWALAVLGHWLAREFG